MANMLEGGGKTPLLPPRQLEEMGFKLCAYPLSLLGVSVRAMEVALQGLKRGEVPTQPAMPSFQARGSSFCTALTLHVYCTCTVLRYIGTAAEPLAV